VTLTPPHHMRGQLAHDAALKSGGVHPIIGADRDAFAAAARVRESLCTRAADWDQAAGRSTLTLGVASMGPFRDGWCEGDVEEVLRRGDPMELLYAPIVVSMDPPDCAWAQSVCVRLATHPDPTVRGNAVLGFGNLARTCRNVDEALVRPLVEAALRDPHEYVSGHASDAASDLRHYLGWGFDVLGEA
jgi:hypothetical protein